MQYITLLITLPLAIVSVLVVLANPEPATVFLWPEDDVLKLTVPMWQLSVGLLFAGFFLGALFVWLHSQKTRFRYWAAARKSARLEKELEDLHRAAEAEKDAQKRRDLEAQNESKAIVDADAPAALPVAITSR
ncbi:MAG TPA: LapA family protein [Alphaproteobacteria bacterium]|jgi:hypothetical protein|nr:LapA family protein [Alphaproteobacteria bacterium]